MHNPTPPLLTIPRRIPTLFLSTLVCAITLSTLTVTNASGEDTSGQMTVQFQAPSNDDLKPLADALAASTFFQEMADGVNESYKLPRDLPVYFRQCDRVNAFYDPNKKEITMCYELIARVNALYDENEKNSDEEVDENTLAAAAFFFLHEMGHAFIDLLKIPVTGKEEDAVDDLAAITLIAAEEDEPADSSLFSVVDAFDDLSADYGDIDKLPMWDEHSLTQQRLYSMLCVLYGSNPSAHSGLVGEDGLPKERAARCAAEYKQKKTSWDTLLEDHMKE
jgi:hypothetical protein